MAASRSPNLAIAVGAAIAISVGGMYAMQKDVKRNEGQASVFQPENPSKTSGKTGKDEYLSSSEVSDVVSSNTSRVKPNK
ncbi:hypothetical protein GYMLUDRAFT_256323 [Collybiopsis luxurians FD-317 M1]|nr:hypothetical protein GYMLUDRAFT_256323 [Collybiopsis luxurians FD-317 M1]